MIRIKRETISSLVLFKKSIFQRIFGGMVVMGLLTSIICYLHFKFNIINIEVSSALPGYLGAALGLLLVFRNNSAYDRWWEARKVLGELVNISRNIAINIKNLVAFSDLEKIQLAKLQISFCYALKEHLREGVKKEELKRINPPEIDWILSRNHKPNAIANLMVDKIEYLHNEKHINDIQQYLLIGNTNTLIDILGKCERIKKTPIPVAYAFLLKIFIVIYVIILPFGLLETLGWSVVPLTIILYYLLMTIVLTAEEIEDPFGLELSDLPVDQITRNIEKDVIEILGYTQNEIILETEDQAVP